MKNRDIFVFFAKLLTTWLVSIVPISCTHRPLVDPVNMHYIRVYLDEHLKNITYGYYNESYEKPTYRFPSIVKCNLYNPSTGELIYERYLNKHGQDENGRYFEGYIMCAEDNYRLLLYNWDNEAIQIHKPNNIFQAYAYTDLIPNNKNSVHFSPDLLFVARDLLFINHTQAVDTLFNSEAKFFKASTMVETYFIKLPIKGLKKMKQLSAVINGLSESSQMFDRQLAIQPVGVSTVMKVGAVKDDITELYATFNTFGKLPQTPSELSIIFYLSLTDGKMYSLDVDITDKFNTPEAINNNWIIIDKVYDAPTTPASEGGGFSPSLSEWQEVSTDVYI